MAESENNSLEKNAGNPVLLHDKVAALRKEKEGQSRTPTPPPHLTPSDGYRKSSSSSPTDLLHKKTRKKLEATAWSHTDTIPPKSKESSSGAAKSQLSPLASQYGHMTTIEKKTLDRTIHSLLH